MGLTGQFMSCNFLEIELKRWEGWILIWTTFWGKTKGQGKLILSEIWSYWRKRGCSSKAMSLQSIKLGWDMAPKVKWLWAIISSQLQMFDSWSPCVLPVRRGDRTVHHTENPWGKPSFPFLKHFAVLLGDRCCCEGLRYHVLLFPGVSVSKIPGADAAKSQHHGSPHSSLLLPCICYSTCQHETVEISSQFLKWI